MERLYIFRAIIAKPIVCLMTKCLFTFLLIISLHFTANAQLHLSWFDECGMFADFETEPPSQQKGIQATYDQFMFDFGSNQQISDSLGNVLFEVMLYLPNGLLGDSTLIEVLHHSGRRDTVMALPGRTSWQRIRQPDVLKSPEKNNLYYIVYTVLHDTTGGHPPFRKEYLRYDADQGKIIDRKPIQLFDYSDFKEAHPSIKGKIYPDGSVYLLEYQLNHAIPKIFDSSATLYSIKNGKIQVLSVINNVLMPNVSQVNKLAPICFYHKQKAFLMVTENGIEKVAFSSEGIVGQELIWQNKTRVNLLVSEMTLSPNDSFLYLSVTNYDAPSLNGSGLYQFNMLSKAFHKLNSTGSKMVLAPNGKIYSNHSAFVVQQPNLPHPLCKSNIIDAGRYPCSDGWLDDHFYTYVPSSNLNHFVWFRHRRTCVDSLKLYNRSGSIFKTFD